MGGSLHQGWLPYDPGELVFWSGAIWWRQARASGTVVADVRPVFWWRSRTCGIIVAAFVRVLTYARWGRGVLVWWKVLTVVTPSAATVPTLFIGSLLTWLFIARLGLPVTPIGKPPPTGLDEGRDDLYLLTPRRLVVVGTGYDQSMTVRIVTRRFSQFILEDLIRFVKCAHRGTVWKTIDDSRRSKMSNVHFVLGGDILIWKIYFSQIRLFWFGTMYEIIQ